MTDNQIQDQKGCFTASVTGNQKIGKSFHKLSVLLSEAGAQAFAGTRPGQFAQLDLSQTAPPPQDKIPTELQDAATRQITLRRPYSFCDVKVEQKVTHIEILYCATGPASLRMTTLKTGDSLNMIGPLGNGFWIPEGKKTALLIAGGMGAPPLQHLAKVLTKEHTDITGLAFAGAKTKRDLPYQGRLDDVSKEIGYPLNEFSRYSMESQIATDDGSLGFEGPVTKCLEQWLKENDSPAEEVIIYACGPEAMLAEVARLAKEKNIDCQVSMERRMGCGIGVCQSCAVECRVSDSSETVYKLCCKDGPVFDAKKVIFGH